MRQRISKNIVSDRIIKYVEQSMAEIITYIKRLTDPSSARMRRILYNDASDPV